MIRALFLLSLLWMQTLSGNIDVPPMRVQVPLEVDVPAAQEMRDVKVGCNHSDGNVTTAMACDPNYTRPIKIWTCTDKSRILLTAEDGTKHCVKFTLEKP